MNAQEEAVPAGEVVDETLSTEEASKVFAGVRPQAIGDNEEEEVVLGGSFIDQMEEHVAPDPDEDKPIPDWAVLPPGFKFKKGKKVSFARLRAAWTEAPEKGDRTIVMWTLDVEEEILAYGRARGSEARSIGELTKQTIRVIDGRAVDWSRGGASAAGALWREIGTSCRNMLQNIYLKTHTLTKDQQLDFFVNCFDVRHGVVG